MDTSTAISIYLVVGFIVVMGQLFLRKSIQKEVDELFEEYSILGAALVPAFVVGICFTIIMWPFDLATVIYDYLSGVNRGP